jgi:hypothetical protein
MNGLFRRSYPAFFSRTVTPAFLVLASFLFLSATGTAQTLKTCFPSCDERDGRMLSLIGNDLESLAGDNMLFSFRLPSTATTFLLEIFDGNTAGLWDKGSNPVIYEVYADPDTDGEIDPGETAYGPFSGAAMADNAWSPISIATSNAARMSASGTYHYTVRMRLQDPTIAGTWSNFKIRSNADIVMETNDFAFSAPLFTNAEAAIIYPNFDPSAPTSSTSLSNSRYDGTWRFFMLVEKARVFGTRPDTAFVDIWDGDMDFGSYDCSARDTDDPNTPGSPFRPAWATGTTAISEGVATTAEPCRDAGGAPNGMGMTTSDPSDDNLNPIYRRSPSVSYVIIGPDGSVYSNGNPSGSREWERFSVSLLGGVPTVHDIKTSSLPDGIYEVRITGMDLNNLNAWHSTFRFVGVCPDMYPCPASTTPGGDDCPTCPPGVCEDATATKGYWKNHPEAWPVTSMMIGGKMRNQQTMLAWLSGTGNDKFSILSSQLVAAKLNVAVGADASCIATTIARAEQWIADNESKRPVTGSAWTSTVGGYASKLDEYNNGKLCAPHRDDVCGEGASSGRKKGPKMK